MRTIKNWGNRIRAGFFRRFNHFKYNLIARPVLKTTPITIKDPDRLCIVSMVSHRDLYMYLVAIKAFYKFIGFGDITVLNDGSLTNRDISILKAHINGVNITDISVINTEKCPKGGCWERLWFILEESKRRYVIQLDSDTITMGPMPEVVEAVNSNTAFALPTLDGKGFVSLNEIYEIVKDWDIDFVQVHAEKALKDIRFRPAEELFYIRANAAFAGFGKGFYSADELEKFSLDMERLIGEDVWNSWGSEQVASNFMIANSPQKTALPYPKYAGYYPDKGNIDYEKSVFLHFIGTQRFKNDFYFKKTRQFLQDY